ncbi:MAG TPA: hypothetical protein VGW78_02945 [Candidatus Babeliales bacterium]|jgi:hypothetical protein|nr:hypothetical protein [Candidatus Babeliales bacterium]
MKRYTNNFFSIQLLFLHLCIYSSDTYKSVFDVPYTGRSFEEVDRSLKEELARTRERSSTDDNEHVPSWRSQSSRDRTPSPKRRSPSPQKPSEPTPQVRYASWSDWWNGKPIVETTAPSNTIQAPTPSETTRGRSKETKESINNKTNTTSNTEPSNTSMPNPLNAASQALGNASDLIIGGSAKGNPLLVPAIHLTPEVISAIIASSGAIAAALKEKQDPLDKIPTRTTNTQAQSTQDTSKEESLSTKTWLKKEVEPLPTIPELPEVVTPHQAAKEHPIDAALQAEKVIAPTGIAIAPIETKPATNGSNLAKVAIFQQLAEQTAEISKPINHPNVHDWEEPTPNTRIEHKSGNTHLKTSRGNTNYSWGTNILFSPITHMLRKMVDAQQPRPQEDNEYKPQPLRDVNNQPGLDLSNPFLDESDPLFDKNDLYFSKEMAEVRRTSRKFDSAYKAYEDGGRNSPTRRRYTALLNASKEILELDKSDKSGMVWSGTKNKATHVIKKYNKEIKKAKKKTERQNNSNSGNNGGKGPNRDRNPQDDASKLAGLAEKQATRPQKAANMNEVFKSGEFGKKLQQSVEKVNGKNFQGQQGYRATKDMPEIGIKKGDKMYLDGLHKDHIEVFKAGSEGSAPRTIISIDGRTLSEKLAQAIKQGRKCPF